MTNKPSWQDEYDNIFGIKHYQVCVGKKCSCHKEVKAFIQDLLDRKVKKIEGLIEKYQKSEEVTVNGQRFLIVGGLKKKFGYPFPDTKEKYLIREIKQALSILKDE